MKDADQDKVNVNRLRKWTMFFGEFVDAWRIIPRTLVALYGVMMYYLIKWFVSLQTHTVTKCDNKLINNLLESGVDLNRAEEVACTVTEVVGGPTNGQTAFVTAVCGLASAIFGFYTKTGNDWSKSIPKWDFSKKNKSGQASEGNTEESTQTKSDETK